MREYDEKEDTGNISDSQDRSILDTQPSTETDTQDFELEEEPLNEEVSSSGSKSKKVAIIAGVGVAVIVAGGAFMMLSGDETPTPTHTQSETKNSVIDEPQNEPSSDIVKTKEQPIINDVDLSNEIKMTQEKTIEEIPVPFKDIQLDSQHKIDQETLNPNTVGQGELTPPNPIEQGVLTPTSPVGEITPTTPVEQTALTPQTPVGQVDITPPAHFEQGELNQPVKTGNDDLIIEQSGVNSGLIEEPGLISPEEVLSVENNEDLNASMQNILSKMNSISSNVKEINDKINTINDKITVGKEDFDKLVARVAELEKLTKEQNNKALSCLCSNGKQENKAVSPAKVTQKSTLNKEKTKYKPKDSVSVVKRTGDLQNEVKTVKRTASKGQNYGSNVKLESIVGDRAWVRVNGGSIKSYGIGDTLPNGKVIGNINSSNGVFDKSGIKILSR